jgi:hypothetical protein
VASHGGPQIQRHETGFFRQENTGNEKSKIRKWDNYGGMSEKEAPTSRRDISAEVREVWIRTGMRLKTVRLKRGLGLRAAAAVPPVPTPKMSTSQDVSVMRGPYPRREHCLSYSRSDRDLR